MSMIMPAQPSKVAISPVSAHQPAVTGAKPVTTSVLSSLAQFFGPVAFKNKPFMKQVGELQQLYRQILAQRDPDKRKALIQDYIDKLKQLNYPKNNSDMPSLKLLDDQLANMKYIIIANANGLYGQFQPVANNYRDQYQQFYSQYMRQKMQQSVPPFR